MGDLANKIKESVNGLVKKIKENKGVIIQTGIGIGKLSLSTYLVYLNQKYFSGNGLMNLTTKMAVIYTLSSGMGDIALGAIRTVNRAGNKLYKRVDKIDIAELVGYRSFKAYKEGDKEIFYNIYDSSNS